MRKIFVTRALDPLSPIVECEILVSDIHTTNTMGVRASIVVCVTSFLLGL